MDLEYFTKSTKWKKAHMREHSMVRRLDPNGEVFVCCCKCSGYATNRQGPKLMNRCQPDKKHRGALENVETNLQVLKKGRFQTRRPVAENRRQKMKATWEQQRFGSGRLVVSCRKQVSGQRPKEDVKGTLPKEHRDLAREEHEAMHEENIFDSWLREDEDEMATEDENRYFLCFAFVSSVSEGDGDRGGVSGCACGCGCD